MFGTLHYYSYKMLNVFTNNNSSFSKAYKNKNSINEDVRVNVNGICECVYTSAQNNILIFNHKLG